MNGEFNGILSYSSSNSNIARKNFQQATGLIENTYSTLNRCFRKQVKNLD